MAIASSARRTARLSRSASLNTATVFKPSSRAAWMMRTAISPRLAMSSLSNIGPERDNGVSAGLEQQQCLPGLDRRLVVDEEPDDLAAGVGIDLGELLHHLDQADDVALLHAVAFLLVGRRLGRGTAVEDSRQRTDHLVLRHPWPPLSLCIFANRWPPSLTLPLKG